MALPPEDDGVSIQVVDPARITLLRQYLPFFLCWSDNVDVVADDAVQYELILQALLRVGDGISHDAALRLFDLFLLLNMSTVYRILQWHFLFLWCLLLRFSLAIILAMKLQRG